MTKFRQNTPKCLNSNVKEIAKKKEEKTEGGVSNLHLPTLF